MAFAAFCGRALWRALYRALYVHCAKHSLCNSASGGVEAHSLFVGSSCEDERVFGLGLCAPIASELPYACRPQLPTVFRARPTVISRLRFICFLVASELWSSKCLFICFPGLYMSPRVPCAARLAGCLSLLASLHVSRGVPIQVSGSSPAPFYFQRQKAVGFQFPEAGGASPLLIDPHMYAGFREARSSVPRCVSQHISALSSTLSLALLTALFSTASPTLSPTLCPTLSPSMFPTAPPTLHPAAFSNASCNALRLQRVPEICFRLVFHFVFRLLPFSFQSLGPLVSKWGFPDVVSQQSPGWCGSFLSPLSSTCRPAFSNVCRPETQMWFPT